MNPKRILLRILLLVRDIVQVIAPRQEVSILCYHGIGDARDGDSGTTVAVAAFEAQLTTLHANGTVFVSLADVLAWQRGERELPRRALALTFDDGSADFATEALPLLERYHAPATLFVVGDAVAARAYLGDQLLSEPAIHELARHPLVTIGYHSRSHPDFLACAGAELETECASRYGARFFAYPGGKYTVETPEILRKIGYEAACTIKPELVQKYGDPFMLPRTVIERDTPLWVVRAATTRASSWYRALRRLWKR